MKKYLQTDQRSINRPRNIVAQELRGRYSGPIVFFDERRGAATGRSGSVPSTWNEGSVAVGILVEQI
jgi:hypothetical protein